MGQVDLEELTDSDAAELRALIEEHQSRTGSPVAQRLLEDFNPGRFVKVMPRDYRRVLLEAAEKQAQAPVLGDTPVNGTRVLPAGGTAAVMRQRIVQRPEGPGQPQAERLDVLGAPQAFSEPEGESV
jgi:hypothetical protein